MPLDDLEHKLRAAQERLKRAAAALAPKHKGGEWEEYQAAHAELLSLEHEVAAAKGEPYAIPLDFPLQWGVGAPLPHLLCSDTRTFLTFYIAEVDPEWDGTYVTVRNPADVDAELLALVEFHHCLSAKLGSPNDEVFHGHPLWGKGLQPYSAQWVEHSPWLAEVQKINQVHRQYAPDTWRRLKHYIFWFHDTTFECLAASYHVEVFHESMSAMLARICGLLLK
jgi:hypothetical protein